MIKEYFANYFLHTSDITFNLSDNTLEVHQTATEPWRITLVDTGIDTQTGGRLKRVARYIGDEDFCLTYGDGIANIDIARLIEFHQSQGRLATITAVQPPGRFGALKLEGNKASAFLEKPTGDGGWINGGYFVMSPEILDGIAGDDTLLEQGPLVELAKNGQLSAYCHEGFFQPVDTIRELQLLEEIWSSGSAPWKVW
jgi:glucose-1-phosphate cytidylyltransferase